MSVNLLRIPRAWRTTATSGFSAAANRLARACDAQDVFSFSVSACEGDLVFEIGESDGKRLGQRGLLLEGLVAQEVCL